MVEAFFYQGTAWRPPAAKDTITIQHYRLHCPVHGHPPEDFLVVKTLLFHFIRMSFFVLAKYTKNTSNMNTTRKTIKTLWLEWYRSIFQQVSWWYLEYFFYNSEMGIIWTITNKCVYCIYIFQVSVRFYRWKRDPRSSILNFIKQYA